jgi:hypothetical protein
MSRRRHLDGEMKPPAGVLAALERWLDANGLRRVALVEPLGMAQAQVSRMFAGSAYLSATQRRAIEKLTEGAITIAALEGKAPAPSKTDAKRPVRVELPHVPAIAHPPRPQTAEDGGAPKVQSAEEAERIVDNLAARAMPAAFKVILEQMVKGKSESERRRCAEILIEHLRGKAKQFEKRESLIQPVEDAALVRKLSEIEANLAGRPQEEGS